MRLKYVPYRTLGCLHYLCAITTASKRRECSVTRYRSHLMMMSRIASPL